jgi:hypothetical protein
MNGGRRSGSQRRAHLAARWIAELALRVVVTTGTNSSNAAILTAFGKDSEAVTTAVGAATIAAAAAA